MRIWIKGMAKFVYLCIYIWTLQYSALEGVCVNDTTHCLNFLITINILQFKRPIGHIAHKISNSRNKYVWIKLSKWLYQLLGLEFQNNKLPIKKIIIWSFVSILDEIGQVVLKKVFQLKLANKFWTKGYFELSVHFCSLVNKSLPLSCFVPSLIEINYGFGRKFYKVAINYYLP